MTWLKDSNTHTNTPERDVMKLSERLDQDHTCGDYGNGLEGYTEQAEELENALELMREENEKLRGLLIESEEIIEDPDLCSEELQKRIREAIDFREPETESKLIVVNEALQAAYEGVMGLTIRGDAKDAIEITPLTKIDEEGES